MVSIAVTVGLLALVVGRLDRSALIEEVGAIEVGWLLLAAALGPLQIAMVAERWRVASAGLGQPFGRGRALREVGLSVLLNQLLPGGVAGDAIRAWRARTGSTPLAATVRAVVVDRVIGLGVHIGVVAVGLVAWGQIHEVAPPPGAAAVTAGVAVAIGALGLAPATVPVLGPVGANLRTVLASPGDAVRVIGLSLLSTVSFLGGFALCGEAVGAPLGPIALTAIPLVLLAMSVPVGVGGGGCGR